MIMFRKKDCTGTHYQHRDGSISNVRTSINSLNAVLIPEEFLTQQGLEINTPCDIIVRNKSIIIRKFSNTINDNTESCIKDFGLLTRKKWVTFKEIIKALISTKQSKFVRTINNIGCVELPLKIIRKLRIKGSSTLSINVSGDEIVIKKVPPRTRNQKPVDGEACFHFVGKRLD